MVVGYPAVKRTLDIVVAVIGLVLASPVIALAAVAIKLDSPGPVIFRQRRLGMSGREFDFYKLRSMRVGAEGEGSGVYTAKGDPRVGRVGRILRATSIDELPQFVNVLKGDMSIVGPRPPLTYHPWPIDQYSAEQRGMFSVRPGITGWAQINGRKEVEWPRRIELNVWYAENYSLLLDLRIVMLTVARVLTNSGNVNTVPTATSTPGENASVEKGHQPTC